ncbi:MAG: signal recognition particle-docking protein FtsY [Desulfarculales bacterium]|nr:signal recognition particle-docking protein FtsY [Desulfarculales bacterium]
MSALWNKLAGGLNRTRMVITSCLNNMIAGRMDETVLDELEEILISSDIGAPTAALLTGRLKARRGEAEDIKGLRDILRQEMLAILKPGRIFQFDHNIKPFVIMIVGVNGVGKTTSIAKLAWRFKNQGLNVILGAGDTFRAAASEQLLVWGQRIGCPVVAKAGGSDPSSVAFAALDSAIQENCDLMLLDTAGRLHTKVNLMEELKKMRRVLDKRFSGAPHQVLLVLDATVGQNALNQARMFHQATPLSGLILTKLDSSAKGGIVLALSAELNLPVYFAGWGENLEALEPFDPEKFVQAIV